MPNTAPIWAPLPGATFGQAVGRFFKKYVTFSGRASQSEFWWVVLFNLLVQLAFLILLGIGLGTSMQGGVVSSSPDSWGAAFSANWLVGLASVLMSLWTLVVTIPSLALVSRRLHDVNMSSWWLLLGLTGVGTVFFLTIGLVPSNPLALRYDSVPSQFPVPNEYQ